MENKNKNKKKEEEEVVEVVKTEQVKSKESNGFAIAGFVCSIISVLSCQGTCIIGLVLSILGLNKAKELNGEGKGLSIAGIVMGAIGTVIMIVTLFIICVVFVVAIIEDETWDEDEYYDLEIADVYDTIGCNSTFCEMADDGSYLKIDTNPKDIADYESTVALKMIKEANSEFDFTESLFERMQDTTKEDGKMTDENYLVEVRWTNSKEKGLEVIYYMD